MSDTSAFIPADPTKRDLLEAQVNITWRRFRRHLQAVGDTVAAVAGERPQSTAELIVLAAEALGEQPEVIAELTPAELANRLQRSATQPQPNPAPKPEQRPPSERPLTAAEAEVLSLFSEAVENIGEKATIKTAWAWLRSNGRYRGKYGTFRRTLARAKTKLRPICGDKTPASAAGREHFGRQFETE